MYYFRTYLLQYILYSVFWTSFCCLQRIAINDKHDLFSEFPYWHYDVRVWYHSLEFTLENYFSYIFWKSLFKYLIDWICWNEYDHRTTMYIPNEYEIPNEYKHWTFRAVHLIEFIRNQQRFDSMSFAEKIMFTHDDDNDVIIHNEAYIDPNLYIYSKWFIKQKKIDCANWRFLQLVQLLNIDIVVGWLFASYCFHYRWH